MELRDLPTDVVKLIIEYSRCGQWFRLSKELSLLASQVISPLNCRKLEGGSLCWAINNDQILAVNSLLKDPRIDPSVNENYAIRYASDNGYKEIVEVLLQDRRVDPAAQNNCAIRWSSCHGHLEIVALLLQGILRL
jgi:hypothetical protein